MDGPPLSAVREVNHSAHRIYTFFPVLLEPLPLSLILSLVVQSLLRPPSSLPLALVPHPPPALSKASPSTATMLFNTVPVTVSALLLSAAQLCSAVNMSQYEPQTGVQAEFKEFLTAFV